MQIFYGLLLLVIFLSVVGVIRSYTSTAVDVAAGRLAQSLALPVPEELVPFILRRTATRLRAIRIGQLAGLVAGAAVLPFVGFSYDNVWLVLALAIVGWTVAQSIAALGTLAPPRIAGVARARAVELDDYLAPVCRVLLGILIAATIVLCFLDVRLRGTDILTIIGLALTLLAVAAVEIVSRRLVAQRQPADTDIELAWNDALRAQVVRDLYGMPTGLAAATLLLAVQSIAMPTFGNDISPFLNLALTGAVLIGTQVARLWQLDRYVLRRLWSAQLTSGWSL